jgi:hypothetical protein
VNTTPIAVPGRSVAARIHGHDRQDDAPGQLDRAQRRAKSADPGTFDRRFTECVGGPDPAVANPSGSGEVAAGTLVRRYLRRGR